MTYRKIQLKDPEGLHARNSVQICMAVRQWDVKVCLRLGEREAAADQILEVMALNADCGDWIEIISEGRGRNRGVGCGSGDPAVRCGFESVRGTVQINKWGASPKKGVLFYDEVFSKTR